LPSPLARSLWHRTRQRLQAKAFSLSTKLMHPSTRITDKALLPQLNYQSQAYPLTR
jgi:hypothetical protein